MQGHRGDKSIDRVSVPVEATCVQQQAHCRHGVGLTDRLHLEAGEDPVQPSDVCLAVDGLDHGQGGEEHPNPGPAGSLGTSHHLPVIAQ